MDGRPVMGASRDRGVVFQGDDSLYGWLTGQAQKYPAELSEALRVLAKVMRRLSS